MLRSKIRNNFQQQIGLNCLKETSKLLHLQQLIFMVLKFAHFRKQIINNWRALKCGAGGGRRSLFCSSVENEGVLHIAKEESNSVHKINRRKCNLICHFLLENCLMKQDMHRKKDGI